MKSTWKTYIIRMFLLLCLIFKVNYNYSEDVINISNVVKKIPQKDQEKLEVFFKTLIINNNFGYTLFGEKPIVFETFSTSFALDNISSPLLSEGWKTWEKYQHLFPSHQFFLENIKYDDCSIEKQCDIILYNLKILTSLYTILTSNFTQDANCTVIHFLSQDYPSPSFLPIFERIFSKRKFEICQKPNLNHFDANTRNIFLSFNNPSKILEKVHQLIKKPMSPKEHQMLGVLLGYGKNNATCFARSSEIFDALVELPYFPQDIPKEFDQLNDFIKENLFFTKNHKLISKDANRTKENIVQMINESNNLTKKWQSLSQIYPDGPMTLIRLPTFIADDALPETQELYYNYNNVRKQIMNLLQEPNFLETVLTKYCRG